MEGVVAEGSTFGLWPFYDEDEVEAAVRILRSGKVNQWTGSVVGEFEQRFAEYCGVIRSVAVMNGTAALEIALEGLGIGVDDEVIVTPRSFFASASAVVRLGAKPVFADIDEESQLITPASVRSHINENTRAIVCVHLSGWPCDMDGFRELVKDRRIALVEDCAQAHGARYKGCSVGALGDVAAWSFCQDKIMSTGGEGGMVTTNDEALYRRMWSLKDHGKSYAKVFESEHLPGFRWLHDSFGTNSRLTEIQAAIGLAQLPKLERWHQQRTQNAMRIVGTANRYEAMVASVPQPGLEHAWYRCNALLRPERLKSGWDRDRVIREISRHGVPCFAGSCPEIYRELAFSGTSSLPAKRLPNARSLGERNLTFLVHPTLSEEDLRLTCHAIDQVMTEASE